MHKKHLIVTLTSVVTCGTVLAICIANKSSLLSVTGADTWFHYSEVPATCESYGVKEYWTDCKGNTQITEPSGGEINDQGQPSAAAIQAIIDTYGVDDERILAKEAHNYVDTVVTDKIGYFGTACSVCGDVGPLSSNLMLFTDIDFTLAQYGAEGGKWGSNVQPTTTTVTYEVTAGNTENEIKLPKINFSLYKTVRFTLSGNVWDARVGLETGSYAFPYSASGIHTGTLTFTRSGLEVNASLECSDGVNQNLVITDSDILNGNKSVSLFMIADDAYRAITAEITDLLDTCPHSFVPDSNCLGKEVCSICGEGRGVDPVIDFVANGIYGMYDWYLSFGAPDAWVINITADSMDFYTYNAGVYAEVCLPRIYFAGFEAVTIDLTIQNASEKYSFNSDLSDAFTVPSASYAAKLVFYDISASSMVASLRDSSNNILISKVITDANVLNGVDGFKFYDEGVGLGTEHLSNYTFIGEHAHNYVADPSCIGKEVCSVCYGAHGIKNPSFDFTASVYGAYDIYLPMGDYEQPGWVSANDAGSISYANYAVGGLCKYHLPRMYFAGYSSVSIDVAVNYSGVKYGLDSGLTTSYETPFAGYPLRIVFENITASSMEVKILDAYSTPHVTATCTDVNVLNGLDEFVVYVEGSGNVGWDAFSGFTFSA